MRSRSESEERRAAEEEAAHEDTRRRGLQPTLAQISGMAAEAQDLPVDLELRARLEGLVAAAEDWEARASGVLNPKKVLCRACFSPTLERLNDILVKAHGASWLTAAALQQVCSQMGERVMGRLLTTVACVSCHVDRQVAFRPGA